MDTLGSRQDVMIQSRFPHGDISNSVHFPPESPPVVDWFWFYKF